MLGEAAKSVAKSRTLVLNSPKLDTGTSSCKALASRCHSSGLIIVDDQVGCFARIIAIEVDLLRRKIDRLVGTNRFGRRQPFLPSCERARQGRREGTVYPDSQVKELSMFALKEKNSFHQDNANVLKTVCALAVSFGSFFDEIGDEIYCALLSQWQQQFGEEFVEANCVLIEVLRGPGGVEASFWQVKPTVHVDVGGRNGVLGQSCFNLFSNEPFTAGIDAA